MMMMIWLKDMILLGATTLDQSGPASVGNEQVFHITQSSMSGTSTGLVLRHI